MHPELIAQMADSQRRDLRERAVQERLAAATRVQGFGRPPVLARLGNRLIEVGLALVGRAGRRRGVPADALLRTRLDSRAPSPG